MASIYDICGDFAALKELINEFEAENEALQAQPQSEQTDLCISHEKDYQGAILYDFLRENEANFANKAEAYARLIKEIEGDMEAIDSELKRLTQRKKAKQNLINRLKTALDYALKSLKVQSLQTSLFKISLAKKPISVIIDDESLLTDEYLKVSYTPNKTLLKEHLQNGVIINGARLSGDNETYVKIA